MASNKELIEQALAIDPEAKVDGLTNKELADLVADLKKGPADEAVYKMAPGKSITCKKGILSGDTADKVTADILHGGEEALAAFVKSGHIVKG